MGARLTGRLLTFARRRRYAPARLNLNDQVLGMAELLERTLGEQIALSTTLERAPWTAVADPSEVENAILNLAINARDAMPNGGRLVIETANVTIDTERSVQDLRLPAGDYVRLSVTDTGLGMPPEVQQKAFEPFFTTKGPGKGTGLGLSTIYGFVQQLRGGVTLYSEPGRGTTINIYLPRAGDVATVHVRTGMRWTLCRWRGASASCWSKTMPRSAQPLSSQLRRSAMLSLRPMVARPRSLCSVRASPSTSYSVMW